VVARTDEQLLAAAARGDADAFGAFYRRHVAAITAFHRRRAGSAEAAFDLTAETFAAVVRGWGRSTRGAARRAGGCSQSR
jgi:DNA-directed RNA polymerase specialized sigma24 family protein